MTVRTTEMNGNAANRIKGTRLTVWNGAGEIVDRFVVPTRSGARRYCEAHPTGLYGKRFAAALEAAK